jgi:probable rRNA maturation factor
VSRAPGRPVTTDSSPSRRRSEEDGESATQAAASGRVELVLANPCRYPDVRRRELRPWLSELLRELAPEATSFAARFTSDREMRRVNHRFRGKDAPTDVLSFPGGASPEGSHLGDVLVAIPTARRQAVAAGHPLAKELRILLLHGVLHCLGYDHETDDGTMERLEARLRRRWITP